MTVRASSPLADELCAQLDSILELRQIAVLLTILGICTGETHHEGYQHMCRPRHALGRSRGTQHSTLQQGPRRGLSYGIFLCAQFASLRRP